MIRNAKASVFVQLETIAEGEVLLDGFAGTMAVLIAGLLRGKKFARYFFVDNNPKAMARAILTMEWCMSHFPFQVDRETFGEMFDHMDIRDWTWDLVVFHKPSIVATGSPCPGFSRAQRHAAVVIDSSRSVVRVAGSVGRNSGPFSLRG